MLTRLPWELISCEIERYLDMESTYKFVSTCRSLFDSRNKLAVLGCYRTNVLVPILKYKDEFDALWSTFDHGGRPYPYKDLTSFNRYEPRFFTSFAVETNAWLTNFLYPERELTGARVRVLPATLGFYFMHANKLWGEVPISHNAFWKLLEAAKHLVRVGCLKERDVAIAASKYLESDRHAKEHAALRAMIQERASIDDVWFFSYIEHETKRYEMLKKHPRALIYNTTEDDISDYVLSAIDQWTEELFYALPPCRCDDPKMLCRVLPDVPQLMADILYFAEHDLTTYHEILILVLAECDLCMMTPYIPKGWVDDVGRRIIDGWSDSARRHAKERIKNARREYDKILSKCPWIAPRSTTSFFAPDHIIFE